MFKTLCLLGAMLVGFLSGLMAQSKVESEFLKGNYEQALHLFHEKKTRQEAGASDYRIAALCNIQLSNYEAAIGNYRDALGVDEKCTASHEGLADALSLMGQNDEALEIYNILITGHADNLRYMAKKANVLMSLRNYNEAGNLYHELFESDSTNYFYFRRLIISRYRQKLYPVVAELFQTRDYDMNIDNELLVLVANSYFRMDMNGEALGVLEDLIKADSLYAPAHERMGHVHFSVYRNYTDAVQHYRIYKSLGGDDLSALRNHAVCEFFTGNVDVAIQIFDTLVFLLPDDAFTWFYAGLSHKTAGNKERALEFFEEAAQKVIPSYASNLYHHLGQSYASNRMFEEAIETYKKVMDLDPDNFQVLYDLAVTFEEYSMNRSIALAYYEQFVKANTNVRAPSVQYAENRIKRIREELFFEEE